MGSWVIGHNLAGYLPESDTYAYADYADAYNAYEDMCRDYADRDDEANDSMADEDWADDDYGSMRATVDAIIRDGDHRVGTHSREYQMMVRDSDDRPIVFWLMWSSERDADKEND